MSRDKELADQLMGRARTASREFLTLDQSAVDRITESVFRATFDARIHLARICFRETNLGVLEHKVIKNAWASLVVYQSIRDQRTVGVISDDPVRGITDVAHPRGPVLAILPVTNPTSTAIFKALICMKTRNPVIFSPHGFAKKCVAETARIAYEAALSAGAPKHCIQWLTQARMPLLEELVEHHRLGLILATSTPSLVRRAEMSGNPAFGVGPGNVPVFVDASADLEEAARKIVHSKTFDNGTVCASEQSLVVTRHIWRRLRHFLEARGSYVCTMEEGERLAPVVFNTESRTMRAESVGKPAAYLAERAGIEVPEGTRLLIAESFGVGKENPFSHEILTTVLALHLVADEPEALSTCQAVLRHGGLGHTAGIYAKDEKVVARWQERLHAGRILINIPTTTGAIGGVMNRLDPSLTLGCGPAAGNISDQNITARNLLNISRVTRERQNETWFSIYGDPIHDSHFRSGDALRRAAAVSEGTDS